MLAVVGAASPAHAAGGRQLQSFTCAGEPVTIAVSPGNEGDNWGAPRVVDGRTLIPVSIEYLVRDDTAAITLDDEIVSHGGPAHAQQETVGRRSGPLGGGGPERRRGRERMAACSIA
jgi:hypothetical protein